VYIYLIHANKSDESFCYGKCGLQRREIKCYDEFSPGSIFQGRFGTSRSSIRRRETPVFWIPNRQATR
jgi:hypothetical protein